MWMLKSGLIIALFFCNTLLHSQTINQTAPANVIVTTTVEFQPAVSGIMSENPYTPLWRYKDSTYFVWEDGKNRVWVTKIQNGQTVTAPLDDNPDYVAQPDGHHRFSMGIDKNGYLHIVGDMHNYTKGTVSAVNPYPVRYQKQDMLYWRSNQPECVNCGFSFVGNRGAATVPPGTGWTFPRFFTDNFGELYFSSLIWAIDGAHVPGNRGFGLYKYNLDSNTWAALGGMPPDTRPGDYYKSLFWENSGFAPDKWFQGYECGTVFDLRNRLHFGCAVNTDVTLPGTNKIIYAVSDDGGINWRKANGYKIPVLPIRGIDGNPNQGDVVATAAAGKVYPNFETHVVVDKNGTPGVNLNDVWYLWNGKIWTIDNEQNFNESYRANTGFLGADGNLIMVDSGGARLKRTGDLDSRSYGHDIVSFPSIHSSDEYGFRRTGVLYSVGVNRKNNTQAILKTTIVPAPLPAGWVAQDIGSIRAILRSTVGYSKGKFTVNDHGKKIDDIQDHFNFVYKTFSGNGSITSRVNTTIHSPQGYSRAGIMMRESLEPNSRHVMQLLAPGSDKSQGAIFAYRPALSAWTEKSYVAGITGTYWLRLVREGNKFSGFISKDGASWIATGQVTLTMPETIYIGLASAAIADGYLGQTATFDNIMLPAFTH